MNTTTIDLEIVAPIDQRLSACAEKTGIETTVSSGLVAAFRPVFISAHQAINDARGVAESVKDATCLTEIKRARECRLAIRRVRLQGEAVRKEQKASALAYGRAVDGFYNILEADITPIEEALRAAEETAERQEAARKDAIESARKIALAPYVQDVALYAVRDMADQVFAALLAGVKAAKEQAEAAAAKAEADRIAAEKARLAEEARIREENAKLQREAEVREAALKVEREAARKAAEAAAAKAKAEREAIEESARKERLRLQAIAEVERQKQEAARKAAEAEATRQRLAKEKLETEARASKEAEVKRIADEAKARAKAERAPDREKLFALAGDIVRVKAPEVKSVRAQAILRELAARQSALAAWLKEKAGEL